ncbi:MAG: GNAT family N-acetyltransferase [Pseudomonadota bacterium]
MSETIAIRNMIGSDLEDIQRITRAISEEDSDANLQTSINQITKNVGDKISLVAESGGAVVGYMISNIIYAGFGLKRSAWIVTVGVDPDYMGQGIGKKMAQELFEIYKKMGITHIYSSVMWDSIDLLSFFKTLGFERSSFINLRKEI